MDVSDEFDLLNHRLQSNRMKGEINFAETKQFVENDNRYLEVACRCSEDVSQIQSLEDELLRGISTVEYDGVRNPGTEFTYVSFVAY
jgi:hypothetical protein